MMRRRQSVFCRSTKSPEDARNQAEMVAAQRDDIEDINYKEGGSEGNWFCTLTYYVKHDD